MIINCECGKKKFNIDSSLIPEEGRLLKCGSCSKIWHYTPVLETKNDEDLDVKIDENIIKNDVHSNEVINNENFTDTNQGVLSEENTEDEKIDIKDEKENEKKDGKIKILLIYFIIILISLLGFIFLLDTIKSYLLSIFPDIAPFFDSFYQTVLDFKLFIKDLVN
jgi:predicted Zn finger-like uncharacterized protein